MRKIDWLYLLSGVSRTINGGFSHKVYDFWLAHSMLSSQSSISNAHNVLARMSRIS